MTTLPDTDGKEAQRLVCPYCGAECESGDAMQHDDDCPDKDFS